MAGNIFDKVASIFGGKRGGKASAAEIGDALDAMRAELANAERAVAAHLEGRPAAVLAGEDARKAFRSRLAELEADLSDAKAALEEIARRHAAAVAAEAEAERRQKRADAEKAQRDGAKRLAEYESHALAIQAILRDVASADVAIVASNTDLPAGSLPLDLVDHFVRAAEGAPRRVVSETVVERWARKSDGVVASDELASRIERHANGVNGWLRHRNLSIPRPDELYVMRRYRRVEIEEAAPADFPRELTVSVALPELKAGDSPIWLPIDPLTADTSGEAVLRHLDRLTDEGPTLARDRVKTLRRVEFAPIEDGLDEGETPVAEAAE